MAKDKVAAADEQTAAAAPVEQTAKATVAPGRSVDMVVGNRIVGYDRLLGTPVRGPTFRKFGPGQEVTLPISEVAFLRERGFLLGAGGTRAAPVALAPDAPQQPPAVTERPAPEHWPSRQSIEH